MENKIISTTSNFRETFEKKPSRFFRVLRFSSKLDFKISVEILQNLENFDYNGIGSVIWKEFEDSNRLNFKKSLHLNEKFPDFLCLLRETQVFKLLLTESSNGNHFFIFFSKMNY